MWSFSTSGLPARDKRTDTMDKNERQAAKREFLSQNPHLDHLFKELQKTTYGKLVVEEKIDKWISESESSQ